jgi:hypothetical protein
MKQRLMLRGDPGRCRHRRHRLDALALNRHQQPKAVIMHRLLSIGMTQHDTERLGRSGCSDTAIIGSSSKAGTAIAIGVVPPGSSSSLPFGGWAMDHFVEPFAPLAFKKIVIITIYLGGVSENNMGVISNYGSPFSPFIRK